jgi:hypothetical protein|eukprot:COSAG01_NODE_15611_length_1319_cov_93.272951_1_plen_261_part_00
MMVRATAELLAALLAAAVASTRACTTDQDCSLLGECTAGVCACDAGWTGHDCAVLRLLPPVPLTESGSAYIAPNGFSSWGMSVVHDSAGDKLYHGFVSEFEHGCDLDSWGTNSFVNHIVATSPSGPWKQAGRALDVWAHNPKLVYDKEESMWVMYHIGSGNTPGKAVNCSKPGRGVRSSHGHHRHAPSSSRDAGTSGASSARPFEIHYAKSLKGPWIALDEETSVPSSPRHAMKNAAAEGGNSLGSSLFTLCAPPNISST